MWSQSFCLAFGCSLWGYWNIYFGSIYFEDHGSLFRTLSLKWFKPEDFQNISCKNESKYLSTYEHKSQNVFTIYPAKTNQTIYQPMNIKVYYQEWCDSINPWKEFLFYWFSSYFHKEIWRSMNIYSHCK